MPPIEKAREIAENNHKTYFEFENDGGSNEVSSHEECYNSAMQMYEWTKEQYEKKLDEAIQLAHEALKGTNSSQHTTDFKGNEWAEKLFNFVSKEL